MKRKIKIYVAVFFLIVLSAGVSSATLARLWSRVWGSSAEDAGTGLTVTSGTNIYVAGYVKGTVHGQTPPGSQSAVMSRFDELGDRAWTSVWGPSNSAAEVTALTADSQGNIYATGQTWDPMDGQPEIGNGDFFLSKIHSDGTREWTRIWGSTGTDQGNAVALDDNGNIYVAGWARGSVNGQPHIDRDDLCLTKFDAQGNSQWTRIWGGTNAAVLYEAAQGVVVYGTNVYVTGYSDADFDGQTCAGSFDVVLTKFSTDGNKQWTRMWGASGIQKGFGVTVDMTGTVYVTGAGGSFNGQVSEGDTDAFLMKISPDGTTLWTRMWGSTAQDSGNALSIAKSSGLIYIVGMAGYATFDGLSKYDGGCFMTCFKQDGSKQWSKRWGTSGTEGRAVLPVSSNIVYVAGTTYGAFDGQTMSGDDDLWLSKWGPPVPPTITNGPTATNITENSADIVWDTSHACDSVVEYRPQGTGTYQVASNTTITTSHDVFLWGLTGNTLYEYVVRSTDEYGYRISSATNTFKTAAPPPGISDMYPLNDYFPVSFMVVPSGSFDRVEFYCDGELYMTDYSPPFEGDLSPAWVTADLYDLDSSHMIEVQPYTESGPANSFFMNWSPEDCMGRDIDVHIISPWREEYLYTDTTFATNHHMLLEAHVAEMRPSWSRLGNPIMTSTTVDRVEFYVDGSLKYTSTNSVFNHQYDYDPYGLSIGRHSVRVRAFPNDGGCPIGDSSMFNISGPPILRISRRVKRFGNYFQVWLTVTNEGSGDAYIDHLVDTAIGLQTCHSTNDINNAVFNFDPNTRQTSVDFTYPRIFPSQSVTFAYCLVPVLFPVQDEVSIGGNGYVDYRDGAGITHHRSYIETTERVEFSGGVPGATEYFRAQLEVAIKHSDYLLVSNPWNLFALYNDDDVNLCLSKMAELATLRNGVLGYFGTRLPLQTEYRSGDLLALGNVFGNGHKEIILGDVGDDMVRGYCSWKELQYEVDPPTDPATYFFPFAHDILPGDTLAVGNTFRYDSIPTNHPHAEIIVANGSGHPSADQGKVTTYVYNYNPGSRTFSSFVSDIGYQDNDVLLSANVTEDSGGPQQDELILLKADDGTIELYHDNANIPFATYSSVFTAGARSAVGNVIGNEMDEIVVAHVADDNIYAYSVLPDGSGLDFTTAYYEGLAPEDLIAVGDVIGDSRGEVILADRSEQKLVIFGHPPTGSHDYLMTNKELNVYMGDAEDLRLLAGNVMGDSKDEIILAHSGGHNEFSAGELSIYSLANDADEPGDRYALDTLLDEGGDWAEQLSDDWTENGFLLLVGETSILPSFYGSWYLTWWGRQRAHYTDRNYASTAGDVKYPELAMGRIPGDNPVRMAQALQASIDIAHGDTSFGPDSAYAASGYPRSPDGESDYIDFSETRDSVADTLRSKGFSVTEKYAPSVSEFVDQADYRDLIFLMGHGNYCVWDDIYASDIYDSFSPGDRHPLVYANSCLTGRYPQGFSLAEAFLTKGASAYIGATEESISPWSGRICENFTSRIDSSRTLGESFRDGLIHRLGVNTYSWDPNYNAYNCAIHEFFGDPKLAINWGSESYGYSANSDQNLIVNSPVSTVETNLPDFVVVSTNGEDHITIPGQPQLLVPNEPIVPTYIFRVKFPRSYRIQTVTLVDKGDVQTGSGYTLPVATPSILGKDINIPPMDTLSGGPWPDRDFAWTVEHTPDGKSELIITTYPFVYDASQKSYSYYKHWKFNIDHTVSSVEILDLTPAQNIYPTGSVVTVDMTLWNTNTQSADVWAVPHITYNGTNDISLQSRLLHSLNYGHSTCAFSWDSSGASPGNYNFCVDIIATGTTNLLAQKCVPFELGGDSGEITDFSMNPGAFKIGDNLDLSGTFQNTGSEPLDGTIIFQIQNSQGDFVSQFSQSFSNLAAGASISVTSLWNNVSLVPRDCQIFVYAVYNGVSTPLWIGHSWEDGALVLETAGGSLSVPGVIQWASVSNRLYEIDYSTNLLSGFELLTNNIVATPPMNVYTDTVERTHGFYRVRESW